jgi:PAS domain S-box-containing protein
MNNFSRIKNRAVPKPFLPFLALVALGFAGNYFSVPLFFGADFLFGSIAVMLVLHFFGARYGFLAALIASSYTYVLWHHPYAVITFAGEALFVGLFLHRGTANIVFLDMVYWLLIGMPQAWLVYFLILHMDAQATLLVMLKQGTNGIFNALMACVMIDSLPLTRWFGMPETKRLKSLEHGLFNLLVLFAFVPALVITAVVSRHEFHRLTSSLEQQIDHVSTERSTELQKWMERRLAAVIDLARVAGEKGVMDPDQLQVSIELIKSSYPEFHSIYAADASGTAIAFAPAINERGEVTRGMNFSDRPYYAELRKNHKSVVSDVFVGRGGTFAPVVTLSAPVFNKHRFAGYVTGALDLTYVEEKLLDIPSLWPSSIMVMDRNSTIIASSVSSHGPLDHYDAHAGWARVPMASHTVQLIPPGSLPSMEKWRKSFYMRKTPIEINGAAAWTLVQEAPLEPLRDRLYLIYIRSLSIMLGLTCFSVFLSVVLSRRLVIPLRQLADVTTGLPSRLSDQRTIAWPVCSVREVDYLVDNAKSMAALLGQKFLEAESANNALQTKNQELENAYEALQQSEERHRTFIEASLDGVYFSDRNGVFRRINRAGAEILGNASGQDIIGRPATDFWYDPKDRERFVKEIKEKKSVKAFVMRARRADGREIVLEATSRLVEDEHGSYAGIEGILRDVTERMLAKHQLEEKNRELEVAYVDLKAAQSQILQQEKMASIGQLAAGVAHEINNPIGFIASNLGTLDKYLSRFNEYSDVLAGVASGLHDSAIDERLAAERKRLKIDLITDDAKKLIVESQDGTERVKVIVQNLKSFSHVDQGQVTDADVNECIETTLNIVWNELKYKATVKKEYGVLPHIRCYPQQLNQVFMNLLVNAAHAIDRQGVITIRTWVDGGSLFASIADTGCGIPTENLARIFEPFFTTKEVGKGTGLGLSITYDIIKKHNGVIDVQSDPGKGTVFTIELPIRTGTALDAKEETAYDRHYTVR